MPELPTLVSVEAYSGVLRRYESGGEVARLTHMYRHGKPATFMADFVKFFRETPDPDWAVSNPDQDDPDPPPAARAFLSFA